MSELVVGTERYGIMSLANGGAVLRPTNSSYWRGLVASYIGEELSSGVVPTIHLTQLPTEVISVDAYVDYAIEYPRVEVQYGSTAIDISDKVSVNHPNPETPGLYALDFMVALPGETPTPIWRSWVSIEEAPLLRRVITPWNRENKAIADINRLVIEPQVTEALYEAGVPIYNFQQANANSAVSQFAAMQYKNARVFVKDGRVFVSGPRLPIGTDVTISTDNLGKISRSLNVGVICTTFDRGDKYFKGDIVSYCGAHYYALSNISYTEFGSVLPTSMDTQDGVAIQCWLRGFYYTTDTLGLPDGEYSLHSLWATIDVNGYLFKMDLVRAFHVRHYWGHYDSRHFYDYATGDLVSIVKDNVISFYQRNDTSIDEKGLEESYRPGHYRNPHWREVYSESNSSEITDPIIKPYSNAANAVVSKTYSAREESFRMYANLVDMPTELVDALGAKFSVILWTLLYRTRETFPGIKAAFNAMGMDINDLHRAYPSVVYSTESGQIGDIYTEIANVRELAKSVTADRVWTFDRGLNPPADPEGSDEPAWIAYSADGNKVQKYVDGEWVDCHTFNHIGSDLDPSKYDYSVNNRYYRASVSLLERLDNDGALYFEDGLQRIDQNYFAGISLAFSRMLEYEIPIYIYLRIKVYLAAVGNATLVGVCKGALYQDAWSEPVGLKVFPGKLFDVAACSTVAYYPKVLFSYEKLSSSSPDSEWETYTDFIQGNGYRYYSFDRAVYVRLVYSSDTAGLVYKVDAVWTSRYTLGCLGDGNSIGTDDYNSTTGEGFKDASGMQATNATHSPDMYLFKGVVGCTLRVTSNTLGAEVECLQWNYIFDDPAWKMDEVQKFADWHSLPSAMYIGNWVGTPEEFKETLYSCSAPNVPDLKFEWGTETAPTLYLGSGMPNRVMFYDKLGYCIGTIIVSYKDRMVLDAESATYVLRIKFTEAQSMVVLTTPGGIWLNNGAGSLLTVTQQSTEDVSALTDIDGVPLADEDGNIITWEN